MHQPVNHIPQSSGQDARERNERKTRELPLHDEEDGQAQEQHGGRNGEQPEAQFGGQAIAESEKSALVLRVLQANKVVHEGDGRRAAELLGGNLFGGLIATHARYDNQHGQQEACPFGDGGHASPISLGRGPNRIPISCRH